MLSPRRFVFVLLTGCALLASTDVNGGSPSDLSVHTYPDALYDYEGVHVYAWHPDGRGQTRIMSASGTLADVQTHLEPIVVGVIREQLALKHLAVGRVESADVLVSYYLMLTGKEPALPIAGGALTSLQGIDGGALMIDLRSAAAGRVIWRGVAETKLTGTNSEAVRLELIRTAVRRILEQFPRSPHLPVN
jgi:hypothetical protein